MAETLKVLLVEDSEEDADLIALTLRRGGFQPKVQRVETRQAMEEALNVCAFDVVVADYSMPRFTMREALDVVRSTGAGCSVSDRIGHDPRRRCDSSDARGRARFHHERPAGAARAGRGAGAAGSRYTAGAQDSRRAGAPEPEDGEPGCAGRRRSA